MSGRNLAPTGPSDSQEEEEICKPNPELMQAAKGGIWTEIWSQLSEGAELEETFLDPDECRQVNLLLVCLDRGHLECVRKLIQRGARGALVDSIIRTAKRGHVDCFRYLLEVEYCSGIAENGIVRKIVDTAKMGYFESVNDMLKGSEASEIVGEWGRRLMNLMIVLGCPTSCVKTLVESGVDLAFSCHVTLLTPFICAIHSNNLACIRLFCERGVEFDIEQVLFCRDEACMEELMNRMASLKKDTRVISYMDCVMFIEKSSSMNILLKYLDGIDSKDMCGLTLLMWACHRRSFNWAKFFLENGADVNAHSNGGETALTIACYRGDYEMVKLVLKHKADVNWQFSGPSYPLSLDTHRELQLRTFWDNSTELGYRPAGENALIVACQFGHDAIIDLLLEYGADPFMTTPTGINGLIVASVNNRPRSVERMIERGVSVNHTDTNGLTALMLSCRHGHDEVVEVLLKRGADLEMRDHAGRTAAMFGFGNAKSAKCMQLLMKHNADIPPEPMKTSCQTS